MLTRIMALLTWPVRELIDYVRMKRRIRALRRRDPFIY
jgi:hypothetical protein